MQTIATLLQGSTALVKFQSESADEQRVLDALRKNLPEANDYILSIMGWVSAALLKEGHSHYTMVSYEEYRGTWFVFRVQRTRGIG
jgi:hypothetical protein